MSKRAYVYIMASHRNGTLYAGVTSDLVKRVYQHRNGLLNGFTKRYDVRLLVWFEACDDIRAAIQREKQIKSWRRDWKMKLIEDNNPEWRDLYPDVCG